MEVSQRVQCVDIGNTRTHIGIYENGKIQEQTYIPTVDLLNAKEFPLSNLLKDDVPISYCSVVPKAEIELTRYTKLHGIKIFNLNINTIKILPISYKFPDQIGQDRLANSLAVYLTHHLPCIVIDIGTATTFDVIDKNNGYIGGVIAPGPQGFLDFLHQNTALLPKLQYSKQNCPRKIGQSTEEAMKIGTSIGYPAMVNGIINEIINDVKLFHKKTKIISTGGIKNLEINDSIEYFQHLTLSGLALAFFQNN
jgi:type III pantothenate kinase